MWIGDRVFFLRERAREGGREREGETEGERKRGRREKGSLYIFIR